MATLLHSAIIKLLRDVRTQDADLQIGPAQLSALSVLVFGGARTIGALAQAEQVSGPTMTRIVDGLVGADLAARKSDVSDRRIVRVAATAKGRRLLFRGRQRRVARLAAALETLEPRQFSAVKLTAAILAQLFAGP